MKKHLKALLGISTISAIASMGVFSITSCANTNPFETYTVGQTISIASQKEADFAKTAAADHINTLSDYFDWRKYPLPDEPFADFNAAQYWIMTDNVSKEKPDTDSDNKAWRTAYACTQIYWEFVYFLGTQWSKGHDQNLNINPTPSDSDLPAFVDINDSAATPVVALDSAYSFVCNGSTIASPSVFSYSKPTDGKHYQLTVGTFIFDSYGLYNIIFN